MPATPIVIDGDTIILSNERGSLHLTTAQCWALVKHAGLTITPNIAERTRRGEFDHLTKLIDDTAAIWLKEDLGIAWEGGIDAAMEAACAEIKKLRKEAAENLEMTQAALRSSRTHREQRDEALEKVDALRTELSQRAACDAAFTADHQRVMRERDEALGKVQELEALNQGVQQDREMMAKELQQVLAKVKALEAKLENAHGLAGEWIDARTHRAKLADLKESNQFLCREVASCQEFLKEGRAAISAIKSLHAFLGFPCVEDGKDKTTIDQRIVNEAIKRSTHWTNRNNALETTINDMRDRLKAIVDTLAPGVIAHGIQQVIDRAGPSKQALGTVNPSFAVGQVWASTWNESCTPVEVLILFIKENTIIGLANGATVKDSVFYWNKDGKSIRGDNFCGDLTKLLKGA